MTLLNRNIHLAFGTVGCILLAGLTGFAQQPNIDLAKLEKQRCPKPAEFASVFSFGYVNDLMPKDDAKFEELLKKLKAGEFNVIHCVYTEKRLELCKKHNIKMMIDLLEADHHVYKNPDKAKALCEKLRNNPTVWGYNIWNDSFGPTGPGRKKDVNNVRQWDPTHPAFCGTYRTIGMEHLTNADLFGYYDFHWKRGTDKHFPHLLSFWKWGRERDAWFYSWNSAASGLAGKGNFNRNLYSANTGIACGLKGILWFLGTDLMNSKTLEWSAAGNDIIKVNQEIMPLRHELAKIGLPTAIYSTPISRTSNDKPLPDGKKEMMPPGLAGNAFPKDFWIQPTGGEFVLGVFSDDKKRDMLFVANHNAYAEQKVALKLAKAGKVSLFQRKAGMWQLLNVQDGTIRLELAAAGGELVQLQK